MRNDSYEPKMQRNDGRIQYEINDNLGRHYQTQNFLSNYKSDLPNLYRVLKNRQIRRWSVDRFP
jgi:hypothetical protein